MQNLQKTINDMYCLLACDLPIYMEPNDVGTIKFPSDRDSGGMYGPNLNCYFKIIVSPDKKVKIVFTIGNVLRETASHSPDVNMLV